MKKSLILAGGCAVLSMLCGCASFQPSTQNVVATNGQLNWISVDATRRGVVIEPRPDGKGYYVCAEPSPDVALSTVNSIMAQLQLSNPNIDAQTQLQFETAVVQLTQRTETITFLRESLYRLCEQSINQNLTSDQIMQQYDAAMKTALMLAQADVAKSQADVAQALTNPAVREAWTKTFGTPPVAPGAPAPSAPAAISSKQKTH